MLFCNPPSTGVLNVRVGNRVGLKSSYRYFQLSAQLLSNAATVNCKFVQLKK